MLRSISHAQLIKARFYAWADTLILAAVITPPDVLAMLAVAIPLILLYEFAIWITGRREAK